MAGNVHTRIVTGDSHRTARAFYRQGAHSWALGRRRRWREHYRSKTIRRFEVPVGTPIVSSNEYRGGIALSGLVLRQHPERVVFASFPRNDQVGGGALAR